MVLKCLQCILYPNMLCLIVAAGARTTELDYDMTMCYAHIWSYDHVLYPHMVICYTLLQGQ